MYKLFQKIDFLLVYDSFVREAESLIKLKAKLVSMNFKVVIIPNHFNRYLNVYRFTPKIIVLPFLYIKSDGNYLTYKKTFPNSIFVNIHSEQISNTDGLELNMPQDEDAKGVKHVCWGKDFVKCLLNCSVKKEDIWLTGNIRIDSLIEEKVNKDISKDLLIPSSFGLTMMGKEYIKNIENLIEKERLSKQLQFMHKSRIAFFKVIYQYGIDNPNSNITLRPHPHVDLNVFERTFLEDINKIEKPSNILIEREGSIREFFKKKGKVVTWHSTTLLEAYLMNKDSCVLAPFPFPELLKMEYFKYFKTVSNVNDLKKWIKNPSNVKGIDDYLEKIYYKTDGNSVKRLSEFLSNELYLVKNVKHNFNLLIFFKALFKDSLKYFLFKIGLLQKLIPHYNGIVEDLQEF